LTKGPQRIPCGIAIELPIDHEAQVRPRSGLSLKGVGVSFGTIDSDYRGELMVTMWVLDAAEHEIQHGDRIAQLVIAPIATPQIEEVESLENSARGAGGHGSTGS
jgi:dUTP pyrophosphatase